MLLRSWLTLVFFLRLKYTEYIVILTAYVDKVFVQIHRYKYIYFRTGRVFSNLIYYLRTGNRVQCKWVKKNSLTRGLSRDFLSEIDGD